MDAMWNCVHTSIGESGRTESPNRHRRSPRRHVLLLRSSPNLRRRDRRRQRSSDVSWPSRVTNGYGCTHCRATPATELDSGGTDPHGVEHELQHAAGRDPRLPPSVCGTLRAPRLRGPRAARPSRCARGVTRGRAAPPPPREVDGAASSTYRFSISISSIDTSESLHVLENRLGTWLRWLRATATFVFIAALCLAVAVLVIAFIPGSPVTQELPAAGADGTPRRGRRHGRGRGRSVRMDPVHDPRPFAGTAAALPADRAARPGSDRRDRPPDGQPPARSAGQ